MVSPATTKPKVDHKKLLILVVCFAVYFILTSLSTPEGLTENGQKAIALMLVAIILWVSEVIPIGVSSILLLVIPNLLGIEPMGDTLSNFMIPTVIFIYSAFNIAQALTGSGLGNRISLIVSSLFGTKPDRVLLSFMLPTTILSMVLLDIPTALILGGLAYALLQKNNCKPGESNFGKAMMVGIPVAAAIGGIGTPAGSGLNILTINLLENTAGVQINFLQWSVIGIPMALILTFIAWFVIKKMYPAEIDRVEGLDDVKQELKELGPLSTKEKKFSAIFIVTLILWFTSPFTGINATVVAIITAGVFYLPGIELATWDRAKKTVGWDSLFLVGAANSLAMMLVSTGASEWIANTFLGGLSDAGIIVLLFAVSAFGVLTHLIVPVANAVLAVAIPICAVLAAKAGINPAYLVLPIGFTASDVFLLPLDPIPLTTYNYGYWKMPDMIKPGVVISLFWIVANVIFMLGAQLLNII